MISSLSRAYERTEEMQKRGIFANLFLLQNRLQALFDHDPRNLGVTLKQFLLLVMVRQAACRQEETTYTHLGALLGCSRLPCLPSALRRPAQTCWRPCAPACPKRRRRCRCFTAGAPGTPRV